MQEKSIVIILIISYLSGVSRHDPGHHPLQVAAQTHSLDSDDGLLGQDGAEEEESGSVGVCF